MKKILLLDDDQLVRSTLARMLAGDGHHVLIAATMPEALEICECEKPDVAVCDVMIPGTPPGSAIAALRELQPSLKILAVSACGITDRGEDMLDVAARMGANQVLEKPFGRADLAMALALTVGRPGDA